ncbi:MAG: hypothetical protein IJM51_08165 [Clostridia bacterium]|nr:hypothetical protein [Clostridia bacterium]
MSYCSNCGGRLGDNGICPNCGGMSEANVKPSQMEDSDVFSCVKSFFSDSPLKGVEKAARTRSASVWVTFGSLFIVSAAAMSLGAFGSFSPSFFREVCGDRMASAIADSAGSSGQAILSFGTLTAHAAIMAMLTVIMLTVSTAIAFVHAEEKPSVNQALNIATFSLLPLSVAMLLSIPVALASSTLGIMLVIIGIIASSVCHYFGIQKASAFRRSPFLTLLCVTVIAAAILALCSDCLAMLFFG